MKALLAEVRDAGRRAFPRHELGEPKVFRIFRDVRFARDKSPYKTHVAGYLPLAGGSDGYPARWRSTCTSGTDSYVGAGHG